MANNIKIRTLSSLAWKFFERLGYFAISLVVQIVLARLLLPEDFGTLAIMLVFINASSILSTSGLNTALVQSPEADSDDFSTVCWLSLVASLILYIVVFFLAPFIAALYELENFTWPLRALMVIVIINAYNSVQVAYLQRILEFKSIFLASLASVIISGAIGIGLAFYNMGLWALVAQQLLYQFVSCVVLAFHTKWKLHAVFNFTRARKLFSFGWKVLASGLIDTGYQSLSDLIIGKQFSTVQLGYISQGKKYPSAFAQALDGSIQPVLLSVISRIQDDTEYIKRIVRHANRVSCFVIIPFMTLLAIIAEPLVRLLLGEQWMPCVWFMRIYCFYLTLSTMQSLFLQALNAVGRSDAYLKFKLITRVYALCFILITAFVLQDVYWTVGSLVISGIISSLIIIFPNKRIFNYSYREQLSDCFPSIVIVFVSAVTSLSISLIGLPDIALIFVQIMSMLIVYLGLSKLLNLEAFNYLYATIKEVFSKRTNI